MNATQTPLSPRIFLTIVIWCLLPWFAVQSQLSINGDAAWLMTATERVLSGEALASAY